MKVASVVIHYAVNELTNHVLHQIYELQNVFAFDNGSPIPFPHVEGLEIFRNTNVEKHSYSHGVNLAMEFLTRAGFDAVWVLNNDVSNLTTQMYEALVMALRMQDRIAAVTPAVTPTPHQEMIVAPSQPMRLVKHIDWVCPMVRVSAWNEIGGFDEGLPGYGDDLDFCHRAKLCRPPWIMAVLPRFEVAHQMGGTMSRLPKAAQGQNDLSAMNTYLCNKWGVKDWTELKT